MSQTKRRRRSAQKQNLLGASSRVFVLDVSEAQERFLNSKARIRAFVGGRGSGKTTIGAVDTILKSLEGPPGRTYAVFCPTYPLARDGAMKALIQWASVLKALDGPTSISISDMRLRLGGDREIIIRSISDPDRSRGLSVSGAWIDEASLIDEDAFLVALGTLREGGDLGWISLTFTPTGTRHWTYRLVSSDPDVEGIRASTRDNPFIHPDFYQMLLDRYTQAFARQEIEGEFVELVGSVFEREWFSKIVSPDKVPVSGLFWVRYWDLALSTSEGSSYTASIAGAQDAQGNIWFRDMVRGRWEWPEQERIIVSTILSETHVVEHGIEAALHGGAAVQQLLRRPELLRKSVRKIVVDRSKLSRALPLAARAEQGKVILVQGPWIPEFINELVAFTPEGGTEYDDQVDAASGVLQMLSAMRSRRLITW